MRAVRIAVTGGSGFIGSHVVDALIADAHEVLVLDTAIRRLNPRATYVDVDILDTPSVAAALRNCEIVFHLAGVSNVDQALEHPVRTFRINVEGTASVCSAAVQSGGLRVVLASSVWVHELAAGDSSTEVGPDSLFDPGRTGHVYTTSKACAELTVRSFGATYQLPWTILRYGIPYGPRMRDELVLARFVQQSLSNSALTIAGDGMQTRNFLYVSDLADAHVEALRAEAEGQVLVLEGTEPVTIRHLAELVRELTGNTSPLRYVPGRTGDYQSRPVAPVSPVLAWQPSTSLRDGVQQYLDWLRGVQAEEAEDRVFQR